MTKIDIPKIKKYLIVQVLAAITGALFLLFDNFAGFYFYLYNSKAHIWGYIYLGSGILPSLLILVGVGALAFSLYNSYLILRIKGNADAGSVEKYQMNSIRAGFFTSILAFVGGFVFVAVSIWEETQSWWLDGGFYGSFIGGLVIVIFGNKVINMIHPNEKKRYFRPFM